MYENFIICKFIIFKSSIKDRRIYKFLIITEQMIYNYNFYYKI
jgi:hypothetical protein